MGKCRLCGKEDQALNEGICAAHGDECAQAYLFGFADGQAAPTSAQKDGEAQELMREALTVLGHYRLNGEAQQLDTLEGYIKLLAALHATPASDGVGDCKSWISSSRRCGSRRRGKVTRIKNLKGNLRSMVDCMATNTKKISLVK